MKKAPFIHRVKIAPALCLGFASLVVLTQASQAAIQVVDPVDGVSVTTTHLGTEILTLSVNGSNVAGLSLSGGNGRFGFLNTIPSVSYTSGASLAVNASSAVGRNYTTATPDFQSGAGPNLNYARFDLDANGVFETVVEMDFGPDGVFTGDVITRYAYDDGGEALDIPDAIAAFNSVPEPGTSLFLLLGAVGLASRRR